MATQKNCLTEIFLSQPKHMFKLMDKKIITVLCFFKTRWFGSTLFATGLQIFFKIDGPKWPVEQKMVGHFLKWWAKAYQTNHSWHLGNILYVHTDCWLYSKTCLKGLLKKEDQLLLNTGQKYCRILQGEHSAILSTFIKLHLLLRSLFCLFWVAA